MFTGIVEAVGTLREVQRRGGDRRFLIGTPAGFLQGANAGDSIACGGVCLTAVEFGEDAFAADVSGETLAATTAAGWVASQPLNLERALTLAKPLGGHLVSGHVDGVGTLQSASDDARSRRMKFLAPGPLARYIARKGSITIDGVSLTVNEVDGPAFAVNIVPHTLAHTTLGRLRAGDAVNLEVDLVARYLERLIAERNA